MANLEIIDQKGKSAGNVDLNEEIFGIEPNESVVFDAIIRQRAGKRQGTSAVKNRSAVRGGGKKPWRQKGTGRARQGSIRSPQWRGGGVVFGPTPRSYAYSLNKKVRRLALLSGLSSKVREENLIVLDALTFEAPKTKEFAQVLTNLSINEKALFVTANLDETVALSARNIKGVSVITADALNVLDLVGHNKLVMTKAAVEKVEEVLG